MDHILAGGMFGTIAPVGRCRTHGERLHGKEIVRLRTSFSKQRVTTQVTMTQSSMNFFVSYRFSNQRNLKKKVTETAVQPRSTHLPLQSSKNTPLIKTLKSVIPSSPTHDKELWTTNDRGSNSSRVVRNSNGLQRGSYINESTCQSEANLKGTRRTRPIETVFLILSSGRKSEFFLHCEWEDCACSDRQ
jgi:hypothetical protein